MENSIKTRWYGIDQRIVTESCRSGIVQNVVDLAGAIPSITYMKRINIDCDTIRYLSNDKINFLSAISHWCSLKPFRQIQKNFCSNTI